MCKSNRHGAGLWENYFSNNFNVDGHAFLCFAWNLHLVFYMSVIIERIWTLLRTCVALAGPKLVTEARLTLNSEICFACLCLLECWNQRPCASKPSSNLVLKPLIFHIFTLNVTGNQIQVSCFWKICTWPTEPSPQVLAPNLWK